MVRIQKHSIILPIILTLIFPLLGCWSAYRIKKFWIFSAYSLGVFLIPLFSGIGPGINAIGDGVLMDPFIMIYVVLLWPGCAILIAFLYIRWNNNIDKNYASRDIPRPRYGWTPQQKEEVRERQYGKCAHCGRPPPRWEYHHVNGDRSDNSMSNCEGLCPNCHSVETHEG
jgi:hypothetical protein